MTNLIQFLHPAPDARSETLLDDALKAVRALLDMPVSYVSVFDGDNVVFRAVSSDPDISLFAAGDVRPAKDSYCKLVRDGDLPQLIPDTGTIAKARALGCTRSGPIGAAICVPLSDKDGAIFGMLCCLSPLPRPTLNLRDLHVMQMIGALAADVVMTGDDDTRRLETLRTKIRNVMIDREHDIFLQPIVDLASGNTLGYEALSRFHAQPYRSPDLWFAEAATVGLQTNLESWAIAQALSLLPGLPAETYLSVNAAPETVASGVIADLLAHSQPARVVLELTEHSTFDDSDLLEASLQELRDMGVRIAVDDLGAGYASLSNVLRLRPDIIKLDISLVSAIDHDAAGQALARAIVHFANEIDATLIAEGIENEAERDTLSDLGFSIGQGFLFARPTSAAELGISRH